VDVATRPTIADAKVLATRCRARGVLILTVGRGAFATASYGMRKQECAALKDVSEQIARLIESGDLVIPDSLRG
jgi:hypothetical protein